jgi:hypothetical protein
MIGQNNFTVPGIRAVLLNAGRGSRAPDGTVEFRAGPQNFLDYFVDGGASVMDELCAAHRSHITVRLLDFGKPAAPSAGGSSVFRETRWVAVRAPLSFVPRLATIVA